MIGAVYIDDNGYICMIEIDGLVYPVNYVLGEYITVAPVGDTEFVDEVFTDNGYIEIIKDDISYIVSIRFNNDTIFEFRA